MCIRDRAYTQFADHYFRLHQAAVGVAETKRQQDLAAAAVTADVSSGESASSEATTSDISSDNHGEAEPAVGDSDDGVAAKPARRRGRSNGKSADTSDNADTVSKPSGATLSPAQLAEAVQDKAVAS